ncbi:hypothetical protein GOODEAATRI_017845, partial [Goodea atripinnis]
MVFHKVASYTTIILAYDPGRCCSQMTLKADLFELLVYMAPAYCKLSDYCRIVLLLVT